MGKLSFDHISPQVERLILDFLNSAFRPTDILNMPLIKSQGGSSRDYGIGPSVAKRIIDKKRTLARRRYTSLEQLEDIPGFGQEKLDDLVDTFSISSAERFQRYLRDNFILLDNFPTYYHQITLESDEAFFQVMRDEELLRQLVIDNVHHLADERATEENVQLAKEQLQTAYQDRYETSFVGSYAFALWFFGFDQDNWFSFETMREPIESYLGQSSESIFVLFKGFPSHYLLSGITEDDLPVVLNREELSIYLWNAELFD